MTPRRFNRFMVDVEVGTNLKLGRLTASERWAFVAGVLPIAAKAPTRGTLMVGPLPATAEDVARQAQVPKSAATSLLAKLRTLGMLEHDTELGGEWIHDWEDWQREPKLEQDAERARRYRERKKADRHAKRHGPSRDASRDVRDESRDASRTKENREEEAPPKAPPEGGVTNVRFEGKVVPDAQVALALRCLDEFNRQAETTYSAWTAKQTPSESLKRILGALSRAPELTFEQATAAIRWRLSQPFWTGAPHTGVVFGPNVLDQALASANGARSDDHVGDGFVQRLNSRADDS